MKAIVITRAGDTGVLQLKDVADPIPADNEVLIKIMAAGVNHTDITSRQGGYGKDPAGMIPGVEAAGIVAQCGANISRWKVGDKVCAFLDGAGYAEYAVVDADRCLPVPEGMSMENAASLPETILTVWNNVFQIMHLQKGERLLVHGGTSGIGVAAIQMAKAFGSEVFTTAGSDEKCEFCEELGATRCINYKRNDFENAFKDERIDVILDYIGGDYTTKNIRILNMDGRLTNIAALKSAKVSVNLMEIMKKRIVITGTMLNPRSNEYKVALAKEVAEKVWPLVIDGTIKPIVHKVFKLAAAAMAHKLMESSDHIGKIVLSVG